MKQKVLFLFTFLASFLMAFLEQKLIYIINIWFNFVLGSFFKQDHILNLTFLGGHAKKWPKCTHISKQKLMWLKIWSIIFFLTLTVRRPFHRPFQKKCRGSGLLSKKIKALYVELNEKAEAATSSYFAPGDFSQYISSVLAVKNQKKIQSKCLFHELSFTDISNHINHG